MVEWVLVLAEGRSGDPMILATVAFSASLLYQHLCISRTSRPCPRQLKRFAAIHEVATSACFGCSFYTALVFGQHLMTCLRSCSRHDSHSIEFSLEIIFASLGT